MKLTISKDPDEHVFLAEDAFRSRSSQGLYESNREKDITNYISDKYPDVLFTIRRDPKFTIDGIRRTMSAI